MRILLINPNTSADVTDLVADVNAFDYMSGFFFVVLNAFI